MFAFFFFQSLWGLSWYLTQAWLTGLNESVNKWKTWDVVQAEDHKSRVVKRMPSLNLLLLPIPVYICESLGILEHTTNNVYLITLEKNES